MGLEHKNKIFTMNIRKQIVKPLYMKNIDFRDYTVENIIEHSVKYVQYYKRFRGCTIDDFPILTKKIIKNNFLDLQSLDIQARKPFRNTSGGSTGEPVVFLQDKEYLMCQRHITYRQKKETGYEFGEPMIKLWGNDLEVLTGKQTFKNRMANFLKNVQFLNSYKMTPAMMVKYIEFINGYSPNLLLAYAQSVYQLVQFAKENSIPLKPLRAVMTTAGTLHLKIKNALEEAFSAKVFNRYGSREVGNIACSSCDSNELVVTNGVFLEVMDENGKILKNGAEGELLVTSLINYSMPLIRYAIGDRGALSRDRMGRQILTKLQGRTTDVFRTKDGGVVDGEFFSDLFYYMPWIYKYQVIQKDFSFIVVKIATNTSAIQSDIKLIEQGIKKAMGLDCRVEFSFFEDIDQLASGKYRYTISEIV